MYYGLIWHHVRSSQALARHDYTIPRILLQSNSNLSITIIGQVLLGQEMAPLYAGVQLSRSIPSVGPKIPDCTYKPHQEGTCGLGKAKP